MGQVLLNHTNRIIKFGLASSSRVPSTTTTFTTKPCPQKPYPHIFFNFQGCWCKHFIGQPVSVLLSVKKVILISNLNLLWGNLSPCPLILSLYATAQPRISLCCVPERLYAELVFAVHAGARAQVHGLVSWTFLKVRGIPASITPDFEAMLWQNHCPESYSSWWVLHQLLPCKWSKPVGSPGKAILQPLVKTAHMILSLHVYL